MAGVTAGVIAVIMVFEVAFKVDTQLALLAITQIIVSLFIIESSE